VLKWNREIPKFPTNVRVPGWAQKTYKAIHGEVLAEKFRGRVEDLEMHPMDWIERPCAEENRARAAWNGRGGRNDLSKRVQGSQDRSLGVFG
jgi:hypothetical protein